MILRNDDIFLTESPSDGRIVNSNLTRFKSYKCLNEFMKKEDRYGNVLIISGSNWFVNYFEKNKTNVAIISYPQQDVHCLGFADEVFDYVFMDQCLSCLQYPWLAIEEIRRVLKPGGLSILTSVCLYPVQDQKFKQMGWIGDLVRFTPAGLKVLHNNFASIELLGSWGSKEVLADFDNCWNIPPTQFTTNVLDCDDNYPITTWIAARKHETIKFTKYEDQGDYHWTQKDPIYARHIDLVQKWVSGFKRVLDVGCGDGRITQSFSESNDFVLGIDIDQHAVNLAIGHNVNVQCIELDAIQDIYDAVYVGDVLEHLEYPKEVNRFICKLRDITNVLFLVVPQEHDPLGYKDYDLPTIYDLFSRFGWKICELKIDNVRLYVKFKKMW